MLQNRVNVKRDAFSWAYLGSFILFHGFRNLLKHNGVLYPELTFCTVFFIYTCICQFLLFTNMRTNLIYTSNFLLKQKEYRKRHFSWTRHDIAIRRKEEENNIPFTAWVSLVLLICSQTSADLYNISPVSWNGEEAVLFSYSTTSNVLFVESFSSVSLFLFRCWNTQQKPGFLWFIRGPIVTVIVVNSV